MAVKNQDVISQKYTPKKNQNLKMSNLIQPFLSEKAFSIFKTCSTFNQFISTKDKDTLKLIRSDSCKNRFCPICSWRKARKDAFMLSIIMEAVSDDLGYNYLFLTLTTPNVTSDNLQAEIDLFNHAFSKLFRRKKVIGAINGYVRKLEITYDRHEFISKEMYKQRKNYYYSRGLKAGSKNPNFDTYNPHFHVILAVDRSYFNDSRKYISQEEWLNLWRECTGKTGITERGTDEITQLYIKKVKGIKTDNAISEIAKYSAKDFEMTESQEVFNIFYKALKGRQLLTFNGVFKDYRKKFELGLLDKYKEKDKNDYTLMLLSSWNHKDLKYEKLYREMDAEEREYFNNMYQDEQEID